MNDDRRGPPARPKPLQRGEGPQGLDSSAGEWPDGLPPCLIYVDKEGRFWHQGAEMTHQGINHLLMEHVDLDEQGRYIISLGGQRCFVEVEDTFFVITRVDARPKAPGPAYEFRLTLNDGTQEELDPSTLFQNEENVLYAQVKSGRFPARFLRPGYYQLAEYILEREGRFVLPFRDREYPVGRV
ncbi:MAG: hypothetical protein V1742_00970 [Pseudomonadota bacterium]